MGTDSTGGQAGRPAEGRLLPVWNVAVPAALGSVPVIACWYGEAGSVLLFVLPPITGIAAVLLALRGDTRFVPVAASFWVAQSLALSIAGSGVAVVAALLYGLAPLVAVYGIGAALRRGSGPASAPRGRFETQVGRLRPLEEDHAAGRLTPEEYAARRAEVLGNLRES